MTTNTAHLNEAERQRYLEKTLIIGCDPYLLSATLFCPLKSAKRLPQLSFPDIYIYLVHNPSPYTGDSLKALKSTSICSCRMGERHQDMASGDKKYVCHHMTS